jgi:hypothetical protein
MPNKHFSILNNHIVSGSYSDEYNAIITEKKLLRFKHKRREEKQKFA